MHNCSVHHTDEVNCPETFSCVKHYLNMHVSVAAAFHDPAELLKAAVESVTPE